MNRAIILCTASWFFFPATAKADTYVLVFSYYNNYKEPQKIIRILKKNYPAVHVQVMMRERATKEHYVAALKRLQHKVKTGDAAIIFIYSHGRVKKGQFGANVAENAILSAKEIHDSAEAITVPTLLIVDACQCGGLLTERFAKTTVVCACSASESSYDGCTTKAFAEALQGRADANRDGLLELGEIVSYIRQRTLMIAAKAQENQHPVVHLGHGLNYVVR